MCRLEICSFDSHGSVNVVSLSFVFVFYFAFISRYQQLDGARVAFVTEEVALVCLGNGALYSLELHNFRRNGGESRRRMFLSLFALGHRVGGLGVASCLSVMTASNHAGSVGRYLVENGDNREDRGLSKNNKDRMICVRGLAFVGSRMGDCTLLAFSMDKPTSLVPAKAMNGVDCVKKEEGVAAGPDNSSSAVQRAKLEEGEAGATEETTSGASNGASNGTAHGDLATPMTLEEMLREEEEALYHTDDEDMDANTPHAVSEEEDSSTSDNPADEAGDSVTVSLKRPRLRARRLVTFRAIRTLDSLVGLGPLGGGVRGLVATCPSRAAPAPRAPVLGGVGGTFSSAAWHHVLPCGYGASGGLAVLTTPGRDAGGSGSVLCEEDLCGIGGVGPAVFGLPKSNLILLGRATGGAIVLRGLVKEEAGLARDGRGTRVEEFEELNVLGVKKEDGMDVDDVAAWEPSLDMAAADVLAKSTLLAVSEFCSNQISFSVFFVRVASDLCDDAYFIVIMSSDEKNYGDTKVLSETNIGLRVSFVHRIQNNADAIKDSGPDKLISITPMVSKASSEDGSCIASVTFGCIWTSGNASVFTISLDSTPADDDHESLLPLRFELSESIFMGDDRKADDINFYESNKIVVSIWLQVLCTFCSERSDIFSVTNGLCIIQGMDIIALPNHIFDIPTTAAKEADEIPIATSSNASALSSPVPDPSSAFSFPPDRVSMHGTWCAKLDSVNSGYEPPATPSLLQNCIVIAVCRRSGLLQIYDNEDALSCSSPVIQFPPPALSSDSMPLPIWQSHGCSHGSSILSQSPKKPRRPESHEVEAAEIRFFVAGPSLRPQSTNGEIPMPLDAEKDAWMLRSLCFLVDTFHGDLQLYSASKRWADGIRLEFSRVPLSNVTRPSDEASRHLVKLRRKGIVPPASAQSKDPFRPNRLHRFSCISGEDGLFAATPRPLWFVSERGAPTVVSHKSRHVSPAGGCPVPVPGFCAALPEIFSVSNILMWIICISCCCVSILTNDVFVI